MNKLQFSRLILNWFDKHGRKNLPWQKQITPYRVWISEIMLQQTQVNTVIPYFQKFIKHFSDVKKLARAELDEVLFYWTGLGYYARARNLHRTAQIIVVKHKGLFPKDLESLQTLPGIGRSTAGAILALSMKKKASILDGNVKRVLARFHAVEGWTGDRDVLDRFWQLAELYTPKERVADYTQAMMDLGALICTRSKPQCHKCPLSKHCMAHLQKRETDFPTAKPLRVLPTKAIYMLMLRNAQDEVFLEKRAPVGIWGGLWSFPECSMDTDIKQWCTTNYGIKIKRLKSWPSFRHTFSHFHMDIHPIELFIKDTQPKIMDSANVVWYNMKKPGVQGVAAPVKQLLVELASE